MDTNGFYGDTFSSGFGDFYTAKRGGGGAGAGLLEETPFSQSAKFYNTVPGAWQQHLVKVRPSLELEGAKLALPIHIQHKVVTIRTWACLIMQ